MTKPKLWSTFLRSHNTYGLRACVQVLTRMSPLPNEPEEPNETDEEMNLMEKEEVGVSDSMLDKVASWFSEYKRYNCLKERDTWGANDEYLQKIISEGYV